MHSLLFWAFLLQSCIGLMILTGCHNPQGDFFADLAQVNDEPTGEVGDQPQLGEGLIVLSGGGVNNSLNTAISVYDLMGRFKSVLFDYAKLGAWPRGLGLFDPQTLIVSVHGTPRLDLVGFDGSVRTFATHASFTGNIFHLTRDAEGNTYVVKANTVEKFDPNGNRIPVIGVAPFINTTLGLCVLGTPHGLTINENGHLVVVNSGNHRINIYDISGAEPTCVSFETYNNTGVWDVVQHPNGRLYIVGQTISALYSANPDGTNFNLLYQYPAANVNPGAIAVLPDGNLIVATHGTNSVDLFDPEGALLEQGFIKTTQTIQVNSILVVAGEE